MKNSELRALRVQLFIVGVLLAGSLALAATLVGMRGWVEPFVCESYRTPYEKFPDSLKRLADSLADEDVDVAAIQSLKPDEKNLLFEDWIARRDPRRPLAPAHCVRADAAYFLHRAERCIVSGNTQQRERAIEFFILAGDHRSVTVIDTLHGWAIERRLEELAASLAKARDAVATAQRRSTPRQ